jgi:hypothetical protein
MFNVIDFLRDWVAQLPTLSLTRVLSDPVFQNVAMGCSVAIVTWLYYIHFYYTVPDFFTKEEMKIMWDKVRYYAAMKHQFLPSPSCALNIDIDNSNPN